MWFHTFWKYKGLTEKVVDQLSYNVTNQNIDGDRQNMCLKVVFQAAGHCEQKHKGTTDQRTQVGDQVKQGTKECDHHGAPYIKEKQGKWIDGEQNGDLYDQANEISREELVDLF